MKGQHHGGKGSAQRPVDQDKYNEHWDAIFTRPSDPTKSEDENDRALLDGIIEELLR
tara:strand:- start:327 stop:497 length:171 start_codon:yes stop_codon:yes gene_type:complete